MNNKIKIVQIKFLIITIKLNKNQFRKLNIMIKVNYKMKLKI